MVHTEFKLRLSIVLDQESKHPPPLPHLFVIFYSVFFLEVSLHRWKDYIDQVVDSINFNKNLPRDQLNYLSDFFTRKTTIIPVLDRFFKFKNGDQVVTDLPNQTRRSLGFKYSLNPGISPQPPPPLLFTKKTLVSLCVCFFFR